MSETEAPAIDAYGYRWPDDGLGDICHIDRDQVELCKEFLSRCTRTKQVAIGSYGLKHVIETWAEKYITNGAAIQAAVELGLAVKPAHTGYCIFGNGQQFHDLYPINGWIFVSRKSVMDAKNCAKPEPS